MKIVVTGSAGLIGYEVSSKLQRRGYTVTGIYRTKPRSVDLIPEIEVLVSDLSDVNSVENLKLKNFDVLVHCAASIPASFNDDSVEKAAIYNRLVDDNIIQNCNAQKLRLIFISSSSVYEQHGQIINELSSVYSNNRYSFEKLTSEFEMGSLPNNPVILRVNAPYGSRQRSQTVLKTFIEKTINGEDIYYYGSGSRTQDFTHCEDIATAVCCVIEKKSVMGIYNIASGMPVSMKKLAELVISLVPDTTSRVLPAGKEDPQEGYRARFDTSKASNLLNWRPRISLKDGLHNWIASIRETK